jgi:hypothetical protein
MSAAQNRFKQARVSSGGSDCTTVQSVGVNHGSR